MINNRFVFFKTKATYDKEVTAGNISPDSIIFIKDAGLIVTQGQEFKADFSKADFDELFGENAVQATDTADAVEINSGRTINVIDSLGSTSGTDALSANQGNVISGKLTELLNKINAKYAINTVDVTSDGTHLEQPIVTVNFDKINGALSLAFKGLVGAQGSSGVADASTAELVNDLTTGGATKFLSAEMGKQLKLLIYGLSTKVGTNNIDGGFTVS